MDKPQAVAVLERAIASIEKMHEEIRQKFGPAVDPVTAKAALMMVRKDEYEALKLALETLKQSTQ